LEIFSYLTPLAKTLLRVDEPSSIQIKLILNETLNEAQGKLPEENCQKFKDQIYIFGTGMNRLLELEKTVKDYNSPVILKY